MIRRPSIPVLLASAILLGVAGWTFWSYESGGLMRVLLVDPPAGMTRLEAIRSHVLAWGAIAPVVYFLAVTVEVIVAPIPGAMLYAPGGAIFGGFVGGTLSLLGNATGAAIACWIARTFGEAWLRRHVDGTALAALCDRLRARGGWVVFILRLNPFTSSDLVSYAAGLAGVPPRQAALGTALGMAPQCYAQAYLAEAFFQILPDSPFVFLGIGLAIAAAIVWLTLRKSR